MKPAVFIGVLAFPFFNGCTVSFPQVNAFKEIWRLSKLEASTLDVAEYSWRVTYQGYSTTMLATHNTDGGVKFVSEYDAVWFDGKYVTAVKELGQFEKHWQVAVSQGGVHSLYENGSLTLSLDCGDWVGREGEFPVPAAQDPGVAEGTTAKLSTLYTQVCTHPTTGKQYVNAVGLSEQGTTSYIRQYFNTELAPVTLLRQSLLSSDN